ncbi:MAG: hypothetical protein ABIH46_07465 [Chloroflexota bacterium]
MRDKRLDDYIERGRWRCPKSPKGSYQGPHYWIGASNGTPLTCRYCDEKRETPTPPPGGFNNRPWQWDQENDVNVEELL